MDEVDGVFKDDEVTPIIVTTRLDSTDIFGAETDFQSKILAHLCVDERAELVNTGQLGIACWHAEAVTHRCRDAGCSNRWWSIDAIVCVAG